jgi:hypothetical protein
VFSYSSYWGSWGITYFLRLTQWRQFNGNGFFNLPPVAATTALLLKIGIIAAVFLIAWRRRYLAGRAVIDSIACAWVVFFVFAPGVSVQYMVWLAPFILVLSPTLYGCLTAASTVFLFVFYNSIAGGLPWYIAISRNSDKAVWMPWSLWTWVTLILGILLLWKRAVAKDPSLRLFSFKTLRAQSA